MSKRNKLIAWIALTITIFVFFLWLFRMAVPGIALEFSIGITLILVTGLLAGRAATLVALRSNAIKNHSKVNAFLTLAILAGFLVIAFLLNAMIEKTTFFPFSVTVLFIFLVTMATASLFTIIREQHKAKVTSAQAAMVQSRNELQLLQSRLSPHFLFNTLNNLYGLSLTEATRVPPLLLKLSELLRYSVYDAKEMFVPVRDEIDYLKNYVEFEKLRLGDRLQLTADIESHFDADCKIPPLLLIVFVENAFKHARNTTDKHVVVDMHLRKRSDYIVFSISNSFSTEMVDQTSREKHSGFGLESVRKRLELLYAGRHSLEIQRTDSKYTVDLRLKCQ
ncbi:MAG TPA: histidine kinase [Chryseosolibacter sp.]|nr:histidine kinase [Chryseosolibacter sp.]